MKVNIKNIYQLRAYLQLQRIVYFQLLLIYMKVLKETLESVNVDVTTGTVTYRPTEGGGKIISTENLDNGKYQATYETGSEKAEYTVYGVGISLDPVPSAVLIDNIDEKTGYGYSINDLKVKYRIEPEEYHALIAFVALIEDGEIINIIPSEKTGAGTATFAEGFQFNLNSKYEVQVVLNPGTDNEIRSDKEELMAAKISVVNEDGDEIEEQRYSNGTNGKKRYHIELNIGRLFGEISCENIKAEISTRKQDGNYATVPGTEYHGEIIPLTFKESGILFKKCISQNLYTDTGTTRNSFILTNLSREAIGDAINETAPLYGGIGNKFRIKLSGALEGAMVDMPIEPIGIIVIGIDGLRQDVLYAPPGTNSDADASYSDPKGCGENTSCYVPIDSTNLPGLSQIMTDNGTIKFKDVTAIFPSITLASWASIFTGKMPGETGILGNEFFARDRSLSVPARFNNPTGIISFSSGAFKGFDAFPKPLSLYDYDFFVPYQLNWKVPITPEDTPQNYRIILKPDTLFENIKEIQGVESYFSKSGDSVVVANSHYARGAYWLTWDTPWIGSSANMMDDASWDKFDDYLEDNYLKGLIFKERNNVPFSALTVWYLPGLDHEAHGKGMSVYRDYFVNTTDMYINEVVDKLKELDEFDNKIFIITADHGHTAMPTDLRYKYGTWLGIFDNYEDADTSCELKLDFVDPESPSETYKLQMAELENNNLHIWELGNLFTQFPSPIEGIELRVLAPVEIANVVSGATADINEANIISALNGPMAHIYIKGTNWQDNPDPEILEPVISLLYTVLKNGSNATGALRKIINDHFPNLSMSIDKILVRRELKGVYEVVTGVTEDASGNPIIDTELLDTLDSTDYITPVERIKGMNHSDRSGDIVLIMKDDMGDINQRFSTGVSCKSWHGGLNKSDSYVPFVVAYPGGNKYELNVITQKVCIDNLCEGTWKAKDLITEIIKKQYSGQ